MQTSRANVKKRNVEGRRVAVGAAVLLAGAVFVCGALWLQGYTGAGFAMFVVFAFPTPVAIGLAAGTALPNRGVLWPSAWAAIAAAIMVVVLTGCIDSALAVRPATRIAGIVTAVIIAGLSAVEARQVIARGAVRRAVAATTLAFVTTGLAGYAFAARNMRTFERTVVAEVLLALDSSYFAPPNSPNWRCRRRLDLRCCEMTSVLYKHPIAVFVAPEARTILGISYDLPATGVNLKSDRDARRYLTGLGFRPRLLSSLSRQTGTRDQTAAWCAGFESTRLIVNSDGSLRLRPVPGLKRFVLFDKPQRF